MMRSNLLLFGGIGCLLMGIAGLLKLSRGETALGLLLIGFSISLFSNFRQLGTASKVHSLERPS